MLSTQIRHFWREAENVVTAATGPLLIMASIIATADIFTNHAFSLRMTWLPIAWGLSRAAATVIWLGVSVGFYVDARNAGRSGWGWFLLSAMLFTVDLQTGLLYAAEAEHISAVGELAIVNVSPINWVLETGILAVVLIAVHRVIDHRIYHSATEVTQPVVARLNAQAAPSSDVVIERPAPVARRAYLASQPAPVISEDEDVGMTLELVSDEQGMTRHTPKEQRQQRRDAGRLTPTAELRAQKLADELLRRQRAGENKMTLDDIEDFLDVSRGTAVKDRQEAHRQLGWPMPGAKTKKPVRRPRKRPESDL